MNIKVIMFLFIAPVFITSRIFSQASKLQKNILDSTTQFIRLNINNISSTFSNDGLADYYLYNEQGFRFKYPRDKMLGYTNSGFVVGGKIEGNIKVSGTFYHSAMQPSGDKKIYRVRRDYKTGDLSMEIIDGEGTEAEIRNTYTAHWNNWPAEEGAPYEDKNKNGIYEPEVDIPGYPGSDQTIWFKANDNDTALVKRWFGSDPLGIEVEYTYWGYKEDAPLGNTIFRKYRIKNTGGKEINEMYCSIQSDFDIGDPGDDFVGCDTSLALAFIYNRLDNDYIFNNTPPAVGFIYLNGRDIQNKKIPLSSFNPFINLSPPFEFPASNSYEYGGLFWYNLFQGKTINGNYYIIPDQYGGGNTKFPYAGDPITQTGWVDGNPYLLNNRGMNISVGSINLPSSGTIELVFALITAGGYNNISRLKAIDSLKLYANYINEFYKKISDSTTTVYLDYSQTRRDLILYQNYPNPFNSVSKITFYLPERTNVVINVYDILGKTIKSILAGYKTIGYHTVEFNGDDLASGTYFYEIITERYRSVKKALLLK
ncbi:MAG: T9SS type A sorting domain-containing protein [Melioribacteraceae bacterium]|nr:T9SS type A sorting domain-containing protein [Melioribacteraceae bacterium]